ncbi:efflux RND transporter permease subunit [Photobacterium sp. 1_MG-2023]|uniref:efflux RND transporter permease subunit n=1 Tax=Photobacterium sp. 1_MG-2023 TaxID=3062646 RepID=UPI0026E19702|nr:efflux RND transporter permease subunit [Photobacterium sp. 1_MG-2023]MDO6707527.1 efflux RND transporter permease subunit [Photobacterium sp. 1_MG-2023]
MIRYFASHPTAAHLLMILLILAGLLTLPSLQRETFPRLASDTVRVLVPYPGASPRDVENGICRPLEDATEAIPNLLEVLCEARNNLAQMTLTMEEGRDFSVFQEDIRSAVDSIDSFPDEAETPVVEEMGRTSPVVTIAVTASGLSQTELKTLAEQLKTKMLRQPEIPIVRIEGFSTRQLRVSVSPEQLRFYGLTLEEISQRIASQNLNLPLGSIETVSRTYDLSLDDQRVTAAELANLTIFSGHTGSQIQLSDLATIEERFSEPENQARLNGQPAALLNVRKNITDDSLSVLAAVESFVSAEHDHLPESVQLTLIQNNTSIVVDRLNMLIENAWQGLILVFLSLLLFFRLRFTFWVVAGLPVSFLASFFVLSSLGITLNMMSIVALLLALGILMDDAIVISESIAEQSRLGKKPLAAVTDGVARAASGVLSSFATTVLIFGALLFIEGEIGQVLRVIPAVLLVVISVSLIEAFLILPSHLHHTLMHDKPSPDNRFRTRINQAFLQLQQRTGQAVEHAMHYRYAVLGGSLALLMLSVGMLVSGHLKFQALPDMDGDVLEARLILPSGTPFHVTAQVVDHVLSALNQATDSLAPQASESLVKAVTVTYSHNADAFETGAHLATISVDLLTAEQRVTEMDTLTQAWSDALPALPQVAQVIFTEPSLGPAGRAIELRLQGRDLAQLSEASYGLQQWLKGYAGVDNVFDDLRPGKPELRFTLKPEALASGLTSAQVAAQLRQAFHGVTVDEIYRGIDDLEITVQLAAESQLNLESLEYFPLLHPRTGDRIPLLSVADIYVERDYSRIHRIDSQQTVTVFGAVHSQKANAQAVVTDTLARFLPELQTRFPGISLQVEGEIKNSRITQISVRNGFLIGLIGIFVLLSIQFRTYAEPLIVMLAIPLSLIGVIAGHMLMGYPLTMPSMVGFVSLAGIVVNNAILLVTYVKANVLEGMALQDAARKASEARLRAMLLTTVTTIAGMLPLLFETSLQAQVMIPLVISITFGLLAASLLVLFVVPCIYGILADYRALKAHKSRAPVTES